MQSQPTALEWLSHLFNEDETLEYISSGGSLIRFVVVENDSSHDDLELAINKVANDFNMELLSVDSQSGQTYRPDKIINQLAVGLNWEIYFKKITQIIWKKCRVTNPEIIKLREATLDTGEDEHYLLRKFSVELKKLFGRDQSGSTETGLEDENVPFNRDLGNAFINSSLEFIEGDARHLNVIKGWLRGDAGSSQERRELGILSPVKRENATSLMRGLFRLLSLAGSRGCIFHIDIRGLTDHLNFSDTSNMHSPTKTQRIATYQWIRELIDQMPEFRHTLVLVEVGNSFTDQNPLGKGVGLYDALKNRITDDVTVTGEVNLSAVVVPLKVS